MPVAVIGAGWAGLACAVELVAAGWAVTVFEAGKVAGGRARSMTGYDALGTVDNGQHLLIGPYRETFALMDRIGVDRRQVLRRLPVLLHGTDGLHLRLPAWPLRLGGLAAVASARGLGPGGRRALLRLARAVPAMLSGPDRPVAVWLRECQQPDAVTRRLWAPLCVAALNTPAERASAQVFARVLHDGLLAAGTDASIEVPARPLGELLAEPAVAWLRARGAEVRLGCRVTAIVPPDPRHGGWRLRTLRDEAGPFATVVVAVAPHQAADLIRAHANQDTLARLDSLEYEAIATMHLRFAASMPADAPPLRLLHDGPGEWLVDHGEGQASVVISAWRRGPTFAPETNAPDAQPISATALAAAVEAQLRRVIPDLPPLAASKVIVEKRATFACAPGLRRPGHATGAPGLLLAGDHTADDQTRAPYPATLEGAVRSGLECARQIAAMP
jgi:squalene-associated FAD-dependent desaturase